jgi:hypothetical protein
MPQSPDNNWHLDKKVPIALIFVILAQFGSVLLYVGSIKSKGDDNERRITALEGQKVSERLSSLEAQMSDAKALLIRIDDKVTRAGERSSK